MKKNSSTKILVQCAMFLAIGLVLRNFSYMVYMGGGAGMRIGISGFFTKMPALLFGPVYGAVVSGLNEFFGYVLKPDGAYIFPLTLTAAAGSAITAIAYRWFKKVPASSISKAYVIFVAAMGVLGASNHIFSALYPQSFWGSVINGFGKKTAYFTYGLYAVCLIGIVVYAVNMILQKKFGALYMEDYIRLFATLLISDVLVTTVNTHILIAFIPELGKLGFVTFYLPRLLQELVSVVISSCVITYLLKFYKKAFK